jgi:hypothetical protein
MLPSYLKYCGSTNSSYPYFKINGKKSNDFFAFKKVMHNCGYHMRHF